MLWKSCRPQRNILPNTALHPKNNTMLPDHKTSAIWDSRCFYTCFFLRPRNNTRENKKLNIEKEMQYCRAGGKLDGQKDLSN